MEGIVEAEILLPLELSYTDLLLLSSGTTPPQEELERVNSLLSAVLEALGPGGNGLLCVTDVPRATELRRELLPFARRLAILPQRHRAQILKDHGLGSDVPLKNPDRSVSSFAMQLMYTKDVGQGDESDPDTNKNPKVMQEASASACEFNHLGNTFKKLGHCMIEVGLLLAQVCDKAIGGRELQESILESCSAKGRLIHYHSLADNLILKDIQKSTEKHSDKVYEYLVSDCSAESGNKIHVQFGNNDSNQQSELDKVRSCKISLRNLWQHWHYDYGIFTVLTSPLFNSSCQARDFPCITCDQRFSSFDGHTYLQLYDPDRNKILALRSPPESLIIQVGESADILSSGKLRSTLHAVGKPLDKRNISRETFVVFLQPSWSKILPYTGYNVPADNKTKKLLPDYRKSSSRVEVHANLNAFVGSQVSNSLFREILESIPPISSRLKEGMTFAEFSRETTKLYYGGGGTQSRK